MFKSPAPEKVVGVFCRPIAILFPEVLVTLTGLENTRVGGSNAKLPPVAFIVAIPELQFVAEKVNEPPSIPISTVPPVISKLPTVIPPPGRVTTFAVWAAVKVALASVESG